MNSWSAFPGGGGCSNGANKRYAALAAETLVNAPVEMIANISLLWCRVDEVLIFIAPLLSGILSNQ